MNSVRAFTLATAWLLIAGCATSAGRLGSVRTGMNESQVQAILGRPYAATAYGAAQVLHYRLADRAFLAGRYDAPGYYFVTLRDGRVVRTGADPIAAQAHAHAPVVVNSPSDQPPQLGAMPGTRTYRIENRGFGNYRLQPTGYNPGIYGPIDLRVQ